MSTVIKLFIALFFISNIAYADNLPTVHQIYQTAESGNLTEAQRMVGLVLQAHPESAKAHFVNAELLAKEGKLGIAKSELETADRLEPGLPFAKPQAVANLKQRIAVSAHSGVSNPFTSDSVATHEQTFPWALLIIGLIAIVLITWFVKAMMARQNSAYQGNIGNPGIPGQGYPVSNGSPNNWNGGGPAATYPGQTGSGIGGNIVSGLATGAAVGAGIVAGEALMHHFTDGSNASANENFSNTPVENDAQPQYDMGGSDFGLNDNTSWDDDTSNNSSDSGGDGW